MTLRGSFLAGIGALVMIHLATAFGAIGLLMRMSPAVQDILAENVYSTEAAEDLMASLLQSAAGRKDGNRERFADALARAKANITEEGEIPAIEDLVRLGPDALAGDPGAMVGALAAAEKLARINREAMQLASDRALNLGMTGAWAAVSLALAGFMISILVVRRILRGVIEPVEELELVVDAHRHGDRFRRCQARTASREMRLVLDAVNELLDRAHRVNEERLDSGRT